MMKMNMTTWMITVGLVAGLAVATGLLWPREPVVAPTVRLDNVNQGVTTNTAVADTMVTFSTVDLPDRDPNFSFDVRLPEGWAAEYVADSQAINFFDPRAVGNSNLDKSMIFVKYFSASSWQTLSTVTILDQSEITINGHVARVYRIVKKEAVPNFSGQPMWRNREHTVTDIQVSSSDPSLFYVFARSPELPETIFSDILTTVEFIPQE